MSKINYQLRKGVDVIHQGEEFYLLSEIPLIVIKINKVLYHLLGEMRRSGFLSYITEQSHQLIDLLNRLVNKGLLIKDEIIETQTIPSISIIIPVKNRPQDIKECLTSLSSLDYPKDKFEIIVVNDGSTDSTSKVIETFGIKAIHLPQSIGASACRNLAAKEARGELLAFTDSDCVAHPNWLKDIVPYFEDEEIGIVGGYVSNYYSRSALDCYEDVKSSLNMGPYLFRVIDREYSNAYVPSCNLIIPKKTFIKVSGFQEDMSVGEDVDLCWRVRKLGYHLLYVPQGKVEHKHRNAPFPMLIRRYDYGTSEAILCLRHRDRRKSLYFPPLHSIFYGFICLAIIFQHSFLIFPALGALSLDFLRKRTKIKKTGLTLGGMKVFGSLLRSYFSFAYFTSSYLVRYYLIFLIPISYYYTKAWGFTLSLLIFSALFDFCLKKPKINVFSFLFFYTLDQLAYQIGVFGGCIKNITFMPYIPVIAKGSKR